jgi:hypothetical protein
VHGAIRAKWAELGWERSPVGYPVSDETVAPDGFGRYNHFSNGGSIYWTPATGANVVWGDIRKRWEALGWERSYLGYPTSDEVDFPEGGRANSFEHGGIYWWADLGAIDLRGVIVHYTGLHCFGETDWDQGSGSDEPYVIVSVTTPTSASTTRTRVYDDVDAGESRPDLIEVHRGPPYCGEARNKDPVTGVIGFQKGPLWRRGSQCSRGNWEPISGCWLWRRSPRSAGRILSTASRSSRSAVS